MNKVIQSRVYWGIFACYSMILAAVPFFYGGTSPALIPYLSATILCASGVCLLTSYLKTRRIRLPLAPVTLMALLLGYGWFMVINAAGVFDTGFWEVMPTVQIFPSLPGSIDSSTSHAVMFRLSAMALVMLAVMQLARKPRYLIGLMQAIAASAALICLLGLIQRAAGATDIYWYDRDILMGKYFYGTFRYHANAGAFINLTWPLIAAFFLSAFPERSKSLKQKLLFQFWGLALLVSSISLWIHGSRGATGIILLILPLWCWLNRTRLRFLKHLSGKVWMTIAGVFVSIILALSITILGMTTERIWSITKPSQSVEMRQNAYQAALPMIPDAGASGFGPGTFKWMFPSYGGGVTPELRGFWRYLHQDYLQTLIEWGYLGSLLWLVFFGLSLLQLIRLLRLPRGQLSGEYRLILRAILVGLLTAALHSSFDFPMQIFAIQLMVFIYLGSLWGIRAR
ncbi:MAG: O-antigen ligase family protein [Verrucomicrobiota bacterium]